MIGSPAIAFISKRRNSDWSNGVIEYWSNGVLEYWSHGVMEYWSIGVLGIKLLPFPKPPFVLFDFPSLPYSNIPFLIFRALDRQT
jgi:hypothetical protein